MKKPKILLVDDDVECIESVTLVLENSNYDVISAQNGTEGLQKAVAEQPDLILLDVMMSHATEGFEVLQKLRADARTGDIPVMMLTAIGASPRFAGMKFDTEQLPADRFLEKPVKPGVLLSQIEKLLES